VVGKPLKKPKSKSNTKRKVKSIRTAAKKKNMNNRNKGRTGKNNIITTLVAGRGRKNQKNREGSVKIKAVSKTKSGQQAYRAVGGVGGRRVWIQERL